MDAREGSWEMVLSAAAFAFLSLGFEVYSEDDISSEKFAFDNLNFAADHPARQMMDTYWIEGTENKSANERLCLRPHLT